MIAFRLVILMAAGLAGCTEAGLLSIVTTETLPRPQARALGSGTLGMHFYANHNTDQWNKCGQAAAATLLDHAGLNPLGLPLIFYDPADRRNHAENDTFVDGLAAKYPPDVAFGLAGTSPQRLAQILTASGMDAYFSSADAQGDMGGTQRWDQAGWPVATTDSPARSPRSRR